MFTKFLAYVRPWELEMLDNTEMIRSDPSYRQELMFVLWEMTNTSGTGYRFHQPNGFKMGTLFFWLNMMEFIVNFSEYTRSSQSKLLNEIKRGWGQLDNSCVPEIDDVIMTLYSWRESDPAGFQMTWVNRNLQEIREKLKDLCKPVPERNANPWMWEPSVYA